MKSVGGFILLLFITVQLFVTVQSQSLSAAVADAVALELDTLSRSVIDDTSAQNFKDGSRYITFKLDLPGGSVTAFRLVSDFDGYLTLYSPSQELLEYNDDADDSDGNDENYESVITTETAEGGTYLVVVSTYAAELSGALELSAKNVPVVDDAALTLPSSVGAVLNKEDDLDDDSRYYDTFTLELASPSTVTFTMTSDALDSYLKILDPRGGVLAENDDKEFVDDPATTDYDESSDFSLNAELVLELDAGSYQLQALSYDTGYYQLFVQGEGSQTAPALTPSKPGAKPGAKPGN
jgi:hypothetical protein